MFIATVGTVKILVILLNTLGGRLMIDYQAIADIMSRNHRPPHVSMPVEEYLASIAIYALIGALEEMADRD